MGGTARLHRESPYRVSQEIIAAIRNDFQLLMRSQMRDIEMLKEDGSERTGVGRTKPEN